MRYFCYLALIMMIACEQATHSTSQNKGWVSSASPEATEAGLNILRKGGNAVDAAIAVSFALAVTEPAMSGLGGGMQVLISPHEASPVVVDGSTLAPAEIPERIEKTDLKYHRRSTIPSAIKTLEYLWLHYGSGQIQWSDLIVDAIRFAEEGFVVGPFRHLVYRKYRSTLLNSPHNTAFFLVDGEEIPASGERLRQPVLAETLRSIAEQGADVFYNGWIAREIASDMKENSGWITMEDLQNLQDPEVSPPVHTTHFGWDIYSVPPPAAGWVSLLALNMLEQLEVNEALRNEELPDVVTLAMILNKAHQKRSKSPFSKTDTLGFNAVLEKAYARNCLKEVMHPVPQIEMPDENGETTHFSVVDKEGNAIAITASINAYFGAKAASPKLGFLYNTYMDDFEFEDPSNPYFIRPGNSAYSSMSPIVIKKEGENVLVLGSPGSKRIISTVVQISKAWMDGTDIIRAVSDFRIHALDNAVYIEDVHLDSTLFKPFRDQDFQLRFPTYDLRKQDLNAYFGGVHAVAFEHGRWIGTADPRRDGLAKNE